MTPATGLQLVVLDSSHVICLQTRDGTASRTAFSFRMPLVDTPSLPVLDLFGLRGQIALVTGASRGEWFFTASDRKRLTFRQALAHPSP